MTKAQYEENVKAILEKQQELIANARNIEEQQNVVKACAIMMNSLNAMYMA